MTQHVVKLLVPRNNSRDVISAEMVLTALATLRGQSPDVHADFGLEIAATQDELTFQVRGQTQAIEPVLAQIRHAYPMCDLDSVSPEHDAGQRTGVARRVIELRLREAPYLPLRTHVSRDGRVSNDDQAQGADPMIGVLAALADLAAGEAVVVQYVLRPMPDDWSKYWRGGRVDVKVRSKATPEALGGMILGALGLMLLFLAVLFLLLSVTAGATLMAGWVLGLGLAGAGMLYGRLRIPSAPDPILIGQKIKNSAFRVRARIFITASTPERAEARVRTVLTAFNGYNLAGGNGFKPRMLDEGEEVCDLTLPPEGWWQRMGVPVLGFIRPPDAELPILNTSEVALLWHLPHATAAVQNIGTVTAKSILAASADVEAGLRIGVSRYQTQERVVHLSPAMMRGHIGLVARTQSGKSNLMALMISRLMIADPDAAIVVLDPHRRLAQTLAGLIPEARRHKAVYLSLADRNFPFGLNLLDRMPPRRSPTIGSEVQQSASGAVPASSASSARFTDKIASDIIGALAEIWPDNWGPRMENYLRGALLTLGYANEILVADHRFLSWCQTATAMAAWLQDQLMRGALGATDIDRVTRVLLDFRALQRPPLGTLSRHYDLAGTLFERYEAARREALAGHPGPGRIQAAALEELCTALETWAENGYQRYGISQRVYGRDKRPLQFTLLDVTPLLLHTDFRLRILGALAGPDTQHVRTWWKDTFDVYRDTNFRLLLEMIQPVLSKMDRFVMSTEARRIFGQPETTIDLPGILSGGGILIADLAAGVVGQDTAALVGATLMNWIGATLFGHQANDDVSMAQSSPAQPLEGWSRGHTGREASNGPAPRPIYIVIDEFQSLPGIDYAFMLTELGKYGARLIMGTQSLTLLDQVNERARAAWLENTGTLVVFRCSADDGEQLSRELATTDANPLSITAADIVGLPDYTCYIRTRNERGRPSVFQCMTDKAPAPSAACFTAVRDASRRAYCRPAADVDAWVYASQMDQGDADTQRVGGASTSKGFHASTTAFVVSSVPAETAASAGPAGRTSTRAGEGTQTQHEDRHHASGAEAGAEALFDPNDPEGSSQMDRVARARASRRAQVREGRDEMGLPAIFSDEVDGRAFGSDGDDAVLRDGSEAGEWPD